MKTVAIFLSLYYDIGNGVMTMRNPAKFYFDDEYAS